MATMSYDDILQAAQQLTPEEQTRLLDELASRREPLSQASGAEFVAFLEASAPIRPEALDAMEQAIEDDLEVIDPRDW